MTKTTSYEISKKLKEAGFEAEADYNFIERNNQKAFLVNIKELGVIKIMNGFGVFIKSYDLETILDALPARIEKNEKLYDLLLRHNILGYYATSLKLDYDNIQLDDYIFELYDHDKSLADTAGKMWLMLKEKGLV